MLVFLIQKGNHINQYDNNRRTPLWLAAKNHHPRICEILLEKQANPFVENKEGRKPIDVTSDVNVKKVIGDYMDKYSWMNNKNFFKSKVLKHHKDDFISMLQNNAKERQKREELEHEENLRGIVRNPFKNF